MMKNNFLVRFITHHWLILTAVLVSVGVGAALLVGAHLLQQYNASGTFTFSPAYLLLVLAGSATLGTAAGGVLIRTKMQLAKRGVVSDSERLGYFAATPLRGAILATLCVSAVLLASLSLFMFTQKSGTAFEWPGIDMGPFLERQSNPSFAQNDFFTNASSLPNPRHLFGYTIIALQSLTGLDWYGVYFVLRVIFLVSIPILWLLVLSRALRPRLPLDAQFLFALLVLSAGIALTFSDRINGISSIGWWVANDFGTKAQTLSIFLGLLFILGTIHKEHLRFLPLLMASSFIHPAIGLFMWAVYCLLDNQLHRLRHYAKVLLLCVALPLLTLALAFPATADFNGSEFVYHYIYENHGFHYLPSLLGAQSSFPWYASFAAMCTLLIAPAALGAWRKDRYLLRFSLGSAAAYAGAVAFQYLFVEVMPIKTVAAIGPIRFTMFAPWLAIALYAYTLARYLPPVLNPFVRDLPLPRPKILISATAAVLFAIIVVGLNQKDDPFVTFSQTYPTLVRFVNDHTHPEDVLLVPPGFPPTHVPLLLKRAVYIGNGFPFTEDGFIEHNKRKALVYGLEEAKAAWTNLQPWEKTSAFYRNLTPEDVREAAAAYRLDYVIFEEGYNSAFADISPILVADGYLVYDVATLYDDN